MSLADRFVSKLSFVENRVRAFRLTFGCPSGAIVLKDLAEFCRYNRTAFDPDPRVHAALEGRRDVFLRILEHMRLTPEQYLELHDDYLIVTDESDT